MIFGDPYSYKVGDRVTLTLSEYKTSFPVLATIDKIWLKFPSTLKEIQVHIILDKHPFPDQLWVHPMYELTVSEKSKGLITHYDK